MLLYTLNNYFCFNNILIKLMSDTLAILPSTNLDSMGTCHYDRDCDGSSGTEKSYCCSEGKCKRGGYCLLGFKHLGDTCNYNYECVSGCCSFDTCHIGAQCAFVCTTNSDCTDGYCCSENQCINSIVCQGHKKNGDQCIKSKECISNYCGSLNLVCIDKPKP